MSDLIDRQAAIDMIEAGKLTKLIDAETAINALKALPSTQSKIIQCKDCKYWKQSKSYQSVLLSFGFCENDYMWIETDDNFYCGYAERKTEN